nr:LuxR C-terminal-related transcriptional regulator [uncultured Carboxylicivirga sp.]
MEPLSFTDLVTVIGLLNTQTSAKDKKKEKIKNEQLNFELTLLSNQFYHIVSFPQFKINYISKNIANILGLDPGNTTLKHLYSLIHPEDLPLILLASKKLIEFLIVNMPRLEPYQMIVTFDYRIKNKDGNYIRVLNQNSMINKASDNSNCQTISLYSDITHYKTSNKIDFDLINYGDPVDFIFPDEEINNIALLFTPREREVLTLLASGKNSAEIGDLLFISKHTVDTHRRHMLTKSHLCNTAELVAFALNNNLF